MKTATKIFIGAGAVGLGIWYWLSTGSANAQIAAHTPPVPIPAPPLPTTTASQADQVAPPVTVLSSGVVTVQSSQVTAITEASMVGALLNWATQTKNPALYAQMINQASVSDITGLYDLLTTYWAGKTATPTAAQTAFWNNLRDEYPFLNVSGAGCTNFACN